MSSKKKIESKAVRTLLIDNYDSYTFNLFQFLAEVNGRAPLVVQNDDFSSWEQLVNVYVPGRDFDNIVLSPGPGHPANRTDIGICLEVIQFANVPILGVCLGHQALAIVYGGEVSLAPEPMHGRLSYVHHEHGKDTRSILYDIPSPFEVVRYHSLVVKSPVPDALEITAHCDDGSIIMAMRHREKPQWGVQFHPESIATAYGTELLFQFKRVSVEWLEGKSKGLCASNSIIAQLVKDSVTYRVARDEGVNDNDRQKADDAPQKNGGSVDSATAPLLLVRKIHKEIIPDTLELFNTLFNNPKAVEANSGINFLLDSAVCGNGSSSLDGARARFSIMGDVSGPTSELVEFSVSPETRSCYRLDAMHLGGDGANRAPDHELRWYTKVGSGEWQCQRQSHVDVFEHLASATKSFSSVDGKPVVLVAEGEGWASGDLGSLPFEFHTGYVGYLGYGLRNLCGVKSCGVSASEQGGSQSADGVPSSRLAQNPRTQVNDNDAFMPESVFMFSDRAVVLDHHLNDVYILALVRGGPDSTANDPEVRSNVEETIRERQKLQEEWIKRTLTAVESSPVSFSQQKAFEKQFSADASFQMSADCTQSQYKANVSRCIEEIRKGETYEVCLTNQLFKQGERMDPASLYRTLRTVNPAPYAAFVNVDPLGKLSSAQQLSGLGLLMKQNMETKQGKFHERASAFSLCSSSPERFIRISSQGIIESKPIKGTVRRGSSKSEDEALANELRNSVKDRAENLMIVDLVRNDLGRVCEVGSVNVPKLMHIESFATVHQLVSTIQGKVGSGVSAMEAVRAAFPGGSMTGAPKLRTMQIIDELEASERGIYSGSLGYLSITGAVDLNIVIRTAVLTPGGISVGTGGAVVALSGAQEEYDEMILKAKALQRSIALSSSNHDSGRIV